MSHPHELAAGDLSIQLLTFSDSRQIEDDESGRTMKKFIAESSYQLSGHEIIRENYKSIRDGFQRAINSEKIDAVISSGGTGITRRDRTAEVVREISDEEIPGFGELFRHLSYKQIGTRGILSQALAARAGQKIIICLPGSPGAVELALEAIILEELPHMVEMARG